MGALRESRERTPEEETFIHIGITYYITFNGDKHLTFSFRNENISHCIQGGTKENELCFISI